LREPFEGLGAFMGRLDGGSRSNAMQIAQIKTGRLAHA
jgi:hypothetical protein